jgi:hypothetical protein
MKGPSSEKQGALLLLRMLIWTVALICFGFGLLGLDSQGYLTRGAVIRSIAMPPQGFMFFGAVLLMLDWILRRDQST